MTAPDLAVVAAKAALDYAGVDPVQVEETVFGYCARQAGNGPSPANIRPSEMLRRRAKRGGGYLVRQRRHGHDAGAGKSLIRFIQSSIYTGCHVHQPGS